MGFFGFFGFLYMMGKEIHNKRGMDKTVQMFKRNKGNEYYWQQLVEAIAQAQHWRLAREQCLAAGQERGFAMAAGVPVVTSNRCGMPYMVRDGESGFLVDPNNPDDIARRLAQLLKNDELRRSMGAKGREIALDRFHPAKIAARTRDVYVQAVQTTRRARAGASNAETREWGVSHG